MSNIAESGVPRSQGIKLRARTFSSRRRDDDLSGVIVIDDVFRAQPIYRAKSIGQDTCISRSVKVEGVCRVWAREEVGLDGDAKSSHPGTVLHPFMKLPGQQSCVWRRRAWQVVLRRKVIPHV